MKLSLTDDYEWVSTCLEPNCHCGLQAKTLAEVDEAAKQHRKETGHVSVCNSVLPRKKKGRSK